MFLKLIALAAVGGAAWLFMRPQIPILPPGIIGKKRKSIATESAPKAKAKRTGLLKETETPQVRKGCSTCLRTCGVLLTQTSYKI